MGYHDRAPAGTEELQGRFDATVEMTARKVDQFAVEINGVLVVSRGQSFREQMRPALPPETAAAVAAIERRRAAARASSTWRQQRGSADE